MIYLKKFELLDEQQEHAVVFYQERRRIFNSYYPIGLFTQNNFKEINFDRITIFYGGNGSGKTTLLNIISNRIFQSEGSAKIDDEDVNENSNVTGKIYYMTEQD